MWYLGRKKINSAEPLAPPSKHGTRSCIFVAATGFSFSHVGMWMEDCWLKGWAAFGGVERFFVVTDTDLCNPYTVAVSLVESDVVLSSFHS